MKKKTALLFWAAFVAGILFIYSCSKREIAPSNGIDAIKIAENWYNIRSQAKTYPINTNQISGEPKPSSKEPKLKPDFSKAYQMRLANGLDAVIIPIKEFQLGNRDISLVRVFAFTISKEGEVAIGRIVEIYGDKDNLAKDADKIIKNHQNKAVVNFTGAIMSYDINYRYLEGISYKNGKAVGKAKLAKATKGTVNGASEGTKALGKSVSGMRTMNENGMCWDVYWVDYYSSGNDVWTFMYTFCEGGTNPGSGTSGGRDEGAPGGDHVIDAADPYDAYELLVVMDSIRIAKRLQCFANVLTNENTVYSARICADIPVNGSPLLLVDQTLSPGHTFIELTKRNGTNTVTETFGFYPKSYTKAAWQLSTPGMIVDNTGHEYNASLLMMVNETQFAAMLAMATNRATNTYEMMSYNCTNYAMDVFNAGRTTPISLTGMVGATSGRNYGFTPNVLYLTIKNMHTNLVGGASIASGTGTSSLDCGN